MKRPDSILANYYNNSLPKAQTGVEKIPMSSKAKVPTTINARPIPLPKSCYDDFGNAIPCAHREYFEKAREDMRNFYLNRPANLDPKLTKSYADALNKTKLRVDLEEQPADAKMRTLGSYDPYANTMYYSPMEIGNEKEIYPVFKHEFGHAATTKGKKSRANYKNFLQSRRNKYAGIDYSQMEKEAPYLFNLKDPNNIDYKKLRTGFQYIGSSPEMYTRRRSMFDVFDLDPSKPITREQAQRMVDLYNDHMESSKRLGKKNEESELMKIFKKKGIDRYANEAAEFMINMKNTPEDYMRMFNEVVVNPDEYEIPMAQNGLNIPGVTDFKMPRAGSDNTRVNRLDADQTQTARINKLIANQEQLRKAAPTRSKASKAWAVVTNPMTALEYKMRGQDIPENFERGERNNYDIATDIINPAFYINSVGNLGAGLKRVVQNPLTVMDELPGIAINTLGSLPLFGEGYMLANKFGPGVRGAAKTFKATSDLPFKTRFKNAFNSGTLNIPYKGDVISHSYFQMTPEEVINKMNNETKVLRKGAYSSDESMSNNSAPLFWTQAAKLPKNYTLVRTGNLQRINEASGKGKRIFNSIPTEAMSTLPEVKELADDLNSRINYFKSLNDPAYAAKIARLERDGLNSLIASNLPAISAGSPAGRNLTIQFMENYKPVLDRPIKLVNQRTGLKFPLTEIDKVGTVPEYYQPTIHAVRGNPLTDRFLPILNQYAKDRAERFYFGDLFKNKIGPENFAQGGLIKYQTRGQVNIPGVTDFKMPRATSESTSAGVVDRKASANYTAQKGDEAERFIQDYQKKYPGMSREQANFAFNASKRSVENQGQIKKADPKRSAASKALAIATNPMTALKYKVKGQDIPENFERGERNNLDMAVDVINPFSYAQAAKDVKSGVSDGNYTQAGLGLLNFIPGKFFGKAASKLDDLAGIKPKSVDKVYSSGRTAFEPVGPRNYTAEEFRNVQNISELTPEQIDQNYKSIQSRLQGIRDKGKYWDEIGAKGSELLNDDMIHYHGTYDGRPIVEVKMPDGTSQHFYKSTGWAGKKGAGAAGTTEDMWQVYGEHNLNFQPEYITRNGVRMKNPDAGKATKNWFIKGPDYDSWYGSNTFRDMSGGLDFALAKKYGLSADELPIFLNQKNISHNVDTYTPQYRRGGMITDPRGQWAHPGQNTRIPGGNITMQGVPYPVLAKANNGMTTMMYPGQEYSFPGADYVDEYPMMRNGGLTKYQKAGPVSQQDSVRHLAGQMMDFEARKGSPSGTGLSDWGYHNSQLPYNRVPSNWHPPQSREQAVNLYMQEIGTNPILGYFNTAMEKAEAGDFLYNTGKDARVYMLDQYLKSIGQPGLPNRGIYNVDTKTPKWTPELQSSLDQIWNQYAPDINKLSVNQRRILLNKGRDFYYQNIDRVNGKPNPSYEATWKPRIWESVNTYKNKYGGLIKAQEGLEYMYLGPTGSDNKEVRRSCGRAEYDAEMNAKTAKYLRKLGKEKGPEQLSEWEDITRLDKEEKKALKEQFKLIKDKYPGLDFNMLVAANRDASRTNVQFGQPERYGQYFDPETGEFLKNTDIRNVDPFMRFYRKQFPKQTKISATDVLDVYNKMPGGVSNYQRYVDEGYFPYTPTMPNQRYGGDPSIPNLQSPVSMYKKGGPVSKIRIKAYGGPMVNYMKGKMTGPNIF